MNESMGEETGSSTTPTTDESCDAANVAKLQTRLGWAAALLEQAGFEEWGTSDAHGISSYYVRENDGEDNFEIQVRIRVSDHFANSLRYGVSGDTHMDFGVSISPTSTRREIEEKVREAIKARDEYLASEDFQRFSEQEAKNIGLKWDREEGCCF